MPSIPKDKALEYLRNALNEIPKFKSHTAFTIHPSDFLSGVDGGIARYERPNYEEWKIFTKHWIKRIFGNRREYMDELEKYFHEEESHIKHRDEALDNVAILIRSMIEEIEDDWHDSESPQLVSEGSNIQVSQSNRVFVIHGHDRAAQETTARFLEKLGLEPVILHEQSNEGRTIIEKFEDHTDVRFAVVLLTPDDTGASKRQPTENRDRARQNVVFEFGYFVRALGRNKVCALVKGDIERPSDLDGVLYIPFDEGDGWKMGLVKELKTAGVAVDANLAL